MPSLPSHVPLPYFIINFTSEYSFIRLVKAEHWLTIILPLTTLPSIPFPPLRHYSPIIHRGVTTFVACQCVFQKVFSHTNTQAPPLSLSPPALSSPFSSPPTPLTCPFPTQYSKPSPCYQDYVLLFILLPLLFILVFYCLLVTLFEREMLYTTGTSLKT